MHCSSRLALAFGSAWALAWLAVGCANEIGSNLEHKRCSANRSCLPGYVCNAAQICVPQSLAARDAAIDDAARPPSTIRAPVLRPPALERPTVQLPELTQDAEATQRDDDAGACPEGFAAWGFAACDDGCVDLAQDSQNCGACAQVCRAPAHGVALCWAGSCDFLCESSFTRCGAECVDLASNGSHCGACGRVCASPASCERGECTLACSSGTIDCGGACVDVQSDPSHCGSCGNVCAAAMDKKAMCIAGSCAPACGKDLELCGGRCVNLETDVNNCGVCAKACKKPQRCMAGHCTGGAAVDGP